MSVMWKVVLQWRGPFFAFKGGEEDAVHRQSRSGLAPEWNWLLRLRK